MRRGPNRKKFLASFFQKRRVFLPLILVSGTAQAETPQLVPTRDVTVAYLVSQPQQPALQVRASIKADGAGIRISGEDLPVSLLIEPPTGQVMILQPLFKLYGTVGLGAGELHAMLQKKVKFDRGGTSHVAGHDCINWTARLKSGSASVCATRDGVILRGSVANVDGLSGAVSATNVQYGNLPRLLFSPPADYHNAGVLNGLHAP